MHYSFKFFIMIAFPLSSKCFFYSDTIPSGNALLSFVVVIFPYEIGF